MLRNDGGVIGKTLLTPTVRLYLLSCHEVIS
jgi:hypothetical protein